MDIAIVNGTVIDGTGAAAVRADVGITDDRIVAVGELAEAAGTTIDAAGRIVAPGFIDAHAHSDFALLRDPLNSEKVMQGVTTNIIGNCALSPAPVDDTVRLFFEQLLQHVFGTVNIRWTHFDELLQIYENEGVAPNLKSLAGQGTIRLAVMGMETRPANAGEMQAMQQHLRAAMEAGALGVSTGLMYPPGSFARTEELIELTRVVADYGGMYATHMRNEDDQLLESLEEAIRIGEEAAVPVQISHHKVIGKPNWGKVGDSLARLDTARKEGLDIDADVYPYTAFSTILGPLLPEVERFPDTPVLIIGARFDKSLIGRYAHEVASERGQTLLECAKDINESEAGAVTVVGFGMCQEDVDLVLRNPRTMIGSDGIESDVGEPHPRVYGTFARVLGEYVRERTVVSLEQAVHKMTGQSAAKFRLTDRGEIAVGRFADIVVFDPETIADVATYEKPRQHPVGIDYVLINGRLAVEGGAQRDVRPGRVLRHSAGQ
ncbi:MAG: D-aminoacylase [Deltaproteobacteria bacterium]|nr:D-aminoacylase [Deltaproteobacteria bacterium]